MNNTLAEIIDKLFETSNLPNTTDYIVNYAVKVPIHTYTELFRNMTLDYYIAIFNVIPDYYKFIINVSNEYPLYSDDFIEDKFGELGGYAMIDGLNHLDPVCKNGECPYKIDIKSLITENSNRRLSENNMIHHNPDWIKKMLKLHYLP